jgi:UDP-N-acetyl-L-fucosamine synthase
MKVATVIGTRPEVIRLSRIIPILDVYTEHILIHTDQNFDYELNQVFFDELDLRKPDYNIVACGIRPGIAPTTAEVIGNIISRLDSLLERIKPDALLILGDTNSCFGAAYAAKRKKIPLFHMEAGNRCFDDRVPEEINRRLIDHMSDINLPYSSIARELLLREGFQADRVIKTGSPLMEVLTYYKSKIKASMILEKLDLKKDNYFLVSCHREENIESKFEALIALLGALAGKFHKKIIISTHPRTRKKIEANKLSISDEIQFLKPFGFFDYVQLQINSKATLSDSGTITEESAILNFPALNLRETHERHEGMEEVAVMMTGFNMDRVFTGLSILDKQDMHHRLPHDYFAPNVAEKVLKIILSYTDYVNRVVWGRGI